MLSVLSDVAVLFLLIVGALLIVGWRSGWFLGDLLDRASDPNAHQPGKPDKPRQPDVNADRRAARLERALGRSPPGTSSPPAQPALANPDARREPTGFEDAKSEIGSTNDNQPARIVENLDELRGQIPTATLEAARQSAIRSASQTFSDHWTGDQIRDRPGWLLFDLPDYLGEPTTSFKYNVPGTNLKAVLRLYPIAMVRSFERSNLLISTSRRKVIQAQWDNRRARRLAS